MCSEKLREMEVWSDDKQMKQCMSKYGIYKYSTCK